MSADLLLISAAFQSGNYIMIDHANVEMHNDDVTIKFLEDAIGRDKPKIIEKWKGGLFGSWVGNTNRAITCRYNDW